jgi:hypothetical protein
MNALRLSLLIFRRMFVYALFVSFGVAFLFYVVNGFVQFSKHVRAQRAALEKIDADVISPKGSSIDHLRRLLKLELLREPALIPSQLYTTLNTDTPPGLTLTPVLFWGSYNEAPVIAADLKLQKILVAEFPELGGLNKDEVIIGRDVARRYHLRPHDTIEVSSEFGNLVSENKKQSFKVKAISELAAWNGAILSPLSEISFILDQVHFVPDQIWNNLILSYIFVTGPENFLEKTKQLIDKRTVAVDLRLSNEVPSLLRLSGMNEKLEVEVLIFALLSSLISLVAFMAIWLPLLKGLSFKLRRSGYTNTKLTSVFSLLAALMLVISLGLAASATYFFPLL